MHWLRLYYIHTTSTSPRQLCDNAGFDATDILNRLRVEHRKGNTWAGVDFEHEGVRNNMEAWEPSPVNLTLFRRQSKLLV